MVHHPDDILLGQIVKARSFRKHTANKLMINFDCTFLVRRTGVTVKDAGATESKSVNGIFSILDLLRIGELASVVGQDYRKQPVKEIAAKP